MRYVHTHIIVGAEEASLTINVIIIEMVQCLCCVFQLAAFALACLGKSEFFIKPFLCWLIHKNVFSYTNVACFSKWVHAVRFENFIGNESKPESVCWMVYV